MSPVMRSALLASAAALLLAGCGPITAGEDTTAAPSPPPPTASPEPAPSSPPPVPGQRAEVVDVVDGDTVKVRTAAGTALTIRVLGIDTPEVYGGTECWGPEASQFAEQTLAGQTVGLVVDDTQDERDRYGRALRYLILPDGGNYSVLAADAGAARSYVYDTPVSEHEAIVAAEQRAQAANRGLWGACDGPEPTQTTEPAPAGDCEPGYDPCVPPYPPDVDCADVDGPITVTGSDPHGLDGNDDGTGCE
jgi:micrococcal nuclease